MEYIRELWADYSTRLETYGYTEEELNTLRPIREDAEQIPREMFDELVRQGVIKRTRKLKKVRSLYVLDGDPKIYYLEHYRKEYQYAGIFKDEQDGE